MPQEAFEGRHVAVTGGTGALGNAVVTHLIAAGAHCHVPCWQESELENFAHAEHDRVTVVSGVDLRDPKQVESYYRALPALWASIHVAGGFDMSPVTETSPEAYRDLMAMNADTCFFCCQQAVASMRRRGAGGEKGGRIVNVAARPALEPRTGASMVPYTMSKAAVAALTQALGEELAAEGIWVNAVAPSIIDTAVNREAMPGADFGAWPSPDALAASIVFLASPANACTRSGVLPVYGES
ncbi:MAG: SDR family NAD(P)-dependent oxidoreductase [Acidobacteriota bacterium]